MTTDNDNYEYKMTSSQLRKIKKPLIERRRRERINDSLVQLKTLLLESTHKDESRYSKMEKADILEMAVRHLKSVQQQRYQAAAMKQQAVINKYRAGFTECAQEVVRYVSDLQLNSQLRMRLVQYLATCVQNIDQLSASGSSGASTGGSSVAGESQEEGSSLTPPVSPCNSMASSFATTPSPASSMLQTLPVVPASTAQQSGAATFFKGVPLTVVPYPTLPQRPQLQSSSSTGSASAISTSSDLSQRQALSPPFAPSSSSTPSPVAYLVGSGASGQTYHQLTSKSGGHSLAHSGLSNSMVSCANTGEVCYGKQCFSASAFQTLPTFRRHDSVLSSSPSQSLAALEDANAVWRPW